MVRYGVLFVYVRFPVLTIISKYSNVIKSSNCKSLPGPLCVATILQGLKQADNRGSSGSVGRVLDLGSKGH